LKIFILVENLIFGLKNFYVALRFLLWFENFKFGNKVFSCVEKFTFG